LRGGPGRAPRILTATTANGVLSFSNMDLHNAATLYVQRAWEIGLIRRSMEFFAKEGLLTQDRDLAIDAGANIGMICIGLLRMGYFRQAIAVEPDPGNFDLLTHNIAQNGMAGRIRPIACALSDRSGTVEMELSPLNFGDHRVRAASSTPDLMDEQGRATVRVPARTLDEIVRDLNPSERGRIGLLWVDVQGHDGKLLRGARETLALGVPIVNELWPYGILRSGMSRNDYLDVLRSSFARVLVAEGPSGDFLDRDPAALESLFDVSPGPERALAMIGIPR